MLIATALIGLGWYQNAKGATLSEIAFKLPLRLQSGGSTAKVMIPVPSSYTGQVVISFQVACKPSSALVNWKVVNRPDNLNLVLEATLAAGSTQATLSYMAKVMCPDEPAYRTQAKVYKPWLKPTGFVLSVSPTIKQLAKKLKSKSQGQDEFVKNVVNWVAKNRSQGSRSVDDAIRCSALLRAEGIPARLIAHLRTSSVHRSDEVWLTEYWTDDGNWAMLDPTSGNEHPGRNSVVVLAIPSPEDENLISSGFPHLSNCEESGHVPITLADLQVANEIRLEKTFSADSEPRIMSAAYRRSQRVMKSAHEGRNDLLPDAEVSNAIRSGPGEFALYLDSKS